MITVRNINGAPERIPNQYCGQHNDSENWYFFESKQEHDDFLNSLPPAESTPLPEPDLSNLTPASIESMSQETIAALAVKINQLNN